MSQEQINNLVWAFLILLVLAVSLWAKDTYTTNTNAYSQQVCRVTTGNDWCEQVQYPNGINTLEYHEQ